MSAVEFFGELGINLPGSGAEANVRCFANREAHAHDDRMPSTRVNRTTGAWCCHGCGAKGGAYDAGLAVGLEPAAVMRLLEAHNLKSGGSVGDDTREKPPVNLPSTDEMQTWTSRLGEDGAQAALASRGWDAQTLARLGWGWDGERITIPVLDKNGVVLGVGRYAPDVAGRGRIPKMLQVAGSARGLAPAPELVVRRQKPLIIVEGEGDAASLAHLGWPAVGVPGANYTWTSADTQRVKDASRVYLLPDADRVGRDLMQTVGAALTDAWMDVRVLDLTPGVEDHSDVGDWLAARPDRTAAKTELAELLRGAPEYALPAESGHHDHVPATDDHAVDGHVEDPLRALNVHFECSENPMDKPLSAYRAFRAPQGWPTLRGDAFHEVVGRIALKLDPHTEADIAGLVVTLLAAAGNAIGPRPHVLLDSFERHGTVLWPCVVGTTSSGRKGTLGNLARRIVEAADTTWSSRHVGNIGSGEAVIWEVRDPVLADTDSGEVEVIDQGATDKRLFVRESEFAGVLRVAGRAGSIVSPVLRQAWDGGVIRHTVKSAPARATGAHVSVHADITPEELTRELTTNDVSNGLANRFLWVLVRKSKELPRGGGASIDDLRELIDELTVSIAHAKTREHVGWAPSYWEEFEPRYPDLTADRPGMLGAATGRGAAYVHRLALTYALLDRSDEITGHHARAALDVWDYCAASAAYLFGRRLGRSGAEAILEVLEEAGEDGMSLTDIRKIRGGRSGFHEDLEFLAANGLAHATRAATTGRPSTRWFIGSAPSSDQTLHEKHAKHGKPANAEKTDVHANARKARKVPSHQVAVVEQVPLHSNLNGWNDLVDDPNLSGWTGAY